MADSTDDSGSIVGGLMGLRDPDLLFNIGAGLMAGAKYGSNAGEGIMQGLQSYRQQKLAQQQVGMNNLQMRMMQARMPAMQQFYSALPGLFGGSPPQGSSPQGAAPIPNAAPSDSAPSPDATTAGGSPGVYGPTRLPAQPVAATPSGQASPTMSSPSQGLMGADPYRMLQVGTMGALAGIPEANALVDAAKTGLQYDPATQTRLAAAKDSVAQDQYLIQQALAQGNRPLAQAIYNGKLQEDLGLLKVSSMGGIQTRIDPATGRIDTFNPSTGIQSQGGVASLIPGMAPALQQKSAAEALGTAQAELVPMVDPVSHQTYLVPKSSLVGGGAGAARQPPAVSPQPGAPAQQPSTATAAAAPGGARPLAGLSPGQKGFLEERGVESAKYVSALQDAADGATSTNYALDQMVASAKGVQLGPGAPARQFVENGVAALAQSLGLDPPKELASYEQLQKYANQIAFAATRQMGSREAAQIVHLQMQSNPNMQLVPEAFTGLVQSMKAMNNYIIAKNTAIQAQSGADNDSALQAASAWTQKIDPRVWALSLGPELAGKLSSSIGVAKIATALPAMAHEDGIAVIRNIPQNMRASVLSRLPVQVKQEILAGMQQQAGGGGMQRTGTTGSF